MSIPDVSLARVKPRQQSRRPEMVPEPALRARPPVFVPPVAGWDGQALRVRQEEWLA